MIRLNLREIIINLIDHIVLSLLKLKDKKYNKNLVLVCKLDAIGDFIIWLDSAKELRNLYSNKKIVFYANTTWAKLAEYFPYWDKVIPIDPKKLRHNFIYRLSVFIRMHFQGYDIAIQPTYSREFLGDSLIRASGAKMRIGSIGDFSNISPSDKTISDTWYTHLIPADKQPLMELCRNAEFVRGLGATGFRGSMARIEKLLDLPPELKFEKPYCVIFPGASWSGKIWPPDRFAAVIAEIQKEHRCHIILCGGLIDQPACDAVIKFSSNKIINAAGKTSLPELVEVIRDASLLVSNDTSAVHIAAAVGTPSVCLLGGGHFGRFIPYAVEKATTNPEPIAVFKKMDCFGCNWRCKYLLASNEPAPCIVAIEIDKVKQACANVISIFPL